MEKNLKGYDLIVKTSNLDVSYDDVGEGVVPIIFLHGFPFNKSLWRGQLEFFLPSFRCLSYDIRAFGNSHDEVSPLGIDLFASDLIQFMDALEIERAVICGLSMGGYIALSAVGKFSERFHALILCDTQCVADTSEQSANRTKTIDEIEAEGTAKFTERFIGSVFSADSIAEKPSAVAQVREVVVHTTPQTVIRGLKALAERSDACASLEKISIPTLIVCGREDEVTPLAQSELMASKIEGSNLQIIENAGHLSNVEQPEQFNKVLLSFLTLLEENNFAKINGDQRMA